MKMKINNTNHVLTDLVSPSLDLIICGTAAGPISAATKHPYSAPNNKFYDILCQIGLTNKKLEPVNHKNLLDFRIGLTDLAKTTYGVDKEIKHSDYDTSRLRSLIIKNYPRFLGFNGKESAKIFLQKKQVGLGLQKEMVGTTKIVVLPSTSWNASRYWDKSPWLELAQLIKQS